MEFICVKYCINKSCKYHMVFVIVIKSGSDITQLYACDNSEDVNKCLQDFRGFDDSNICWKCDSLNLSQYVDGSYKSDIIRGEFGTMTYEIYRVNINKY